MRQTRVNPWFFFAAGALFSCASPQQTPTAAPPPEASTAGPPVARIDPKTEKLHGDERSDPYHWLRKKGDAEVERYLQAENAYTQAMMRDTEALQEKLYSEIKGRIKETDMNVPFRKDGWYYYSRTEEGKQYRIHCRKKDSLEAAEEIFLDVNQLAEGKKFMSLGALTVSDDGHWLAFSTDETGFREHTLQFKDLRSGKLSSERIPKTDGVVFARDNQTVFYVVEDHAKRPCRLYRHTIGADPASDTLVYEEKDERFILGVARSNSRDYIFLVLGSHTTSEVHFVKADKPAESFQVIVARAPDHEYDVEHYGEHFYIRTNSGGRNFRLVRAPVKTPGQAYWKEILPHRPGVMLESFEPFKGHYVAMEREKGLPQVRIGDWKSGTSHRITFPDAVYSVGPGANAEWDTKLFRFEYDSMTTPTSVFDYDVVKRDRKLLKQYEVLGGYDATQYQSERLQAKAPDGTEVPISLVYKKGLAKDGKAGMFLTGYGSYGMPYDVDFSSDVVSLLDRGMVFAVAHIRGGGDLGKPWHDDGRMMKKKNTFTDFIAAAEHLVAEHYTAPDRLVIAGGSAGGLLMGAVTNMRPDLFRGVIASVPFVDVINTMLDDSLPLTVGEFEEWGNPKIKEQYDYMKSYSPYDNIEKKAYPSMLVISSYNDSQVMYWEPAKYVARLRATKTDQNPLLLKMDMDPAGHGGKSGRYERWRERAFEFAWVLKQLSLGDR